MPAKGDQAFCYWHFQFSLGNNVYLHSDKSDSCSILPCLISGNTAGETGLVYTYGSSSGGDAIKNSTFSGNTVNSAAAAIVYFSGATDVTGCLFTNNTVTATNATQKCGILALGGGASNSEITGNAFIDNTVASSGAPFPITRHTEGRPT